MRLGWQGRASMEGQHCGQGRFGNVFLRYLDFIKPLHKLDKSLQFAKLSWPTGEDH